jgi:NADH:ubiquinone oxidoreductase subunit 4 (subunit M)
MVLVAAFTLRALQKTFFGSERQHVPAPLVAPGLLPNERITFAEKLGASLLILATLVVGLDPKLLLDRIEPAVRAMRFLQP